MNLSELSQYNFIQNAFIAGTMIALVSGVMGYFILLKRLSFTAHALSHIGFAGACGAALIGVSLLTGQLLLTAFAALVMAGFGARMQKDSTIGIVLAFALGLGSLFLYITNHFAGSANRILFGDLFSITPDAVKHIAYLSAACLIALSIIARPLWFSALLPELAAARGLPMRLLEYLFFALLAVTITIVSQAVGILLIFTLLIGPPAIALKFSRHFWSSIGLCVLFNLIAVYAGLLLSVWTNWPLSFWISAVVLVAYTARL